MWGIFLTEVTKGVTLSLISIWRVFLRVSISPTQSENSDENCSSLMFKEEIHFIRLTLSLVASSRKGTNFESTTMNETSKCYFLCFEVIDHFPSTGVLESLYADNFMFTKQWLGSGSNIFKTVKGIRLHKAPVSVLYETGIPFEGGVIELSQFSFMIWLICTKFFWILTVSIKNS